MRIVIFRMASGYLMGADVKLDIQLDQAGFLFDKQDVAILRDVVEIQLLTIPVQGRVDGNMQLTTAIHVAVIPVPWLAIPKHAIHGLYPVTEPPDEKVRVLLTTYEQAIKAWSAQQHRREPDSQKVVNP